MTETMDTLDLAATTVGFADLVLGLELYEWQEDAIAPLEQATGPQARRINISVSAPNGAGKDDRVIPTAAYWWVATHKRGRVVITTKSDLQLTQQTIPALERHKEKFEGWESTQSPRYELTSPTGGKIIAFVTNLAARAEGWHKEDDLNGPLLLIVNEAATVDDDIFTALDRCTPNAVLLIGRPGAKTGRFWETHSSLSSNWIRIQAGLKDCPHIPQERIDYIRNTYGDDHPVTRSTLYGEFMEQEDIEKYIINDIALRNSLEQPPQHRPGIKCMFCDFADGGAENTIALRDGNKITLVDAWREKNKFASVTRFISSFRKHKMKAEQITGDAADKEMCDLLKDAGWPIKRQNFGGDANDPLIYTSWSAEAWRELGMGIEKREWILPNDPETRAQLTSRQRVFGAKGKLGVEDKHDMCKRLKKPDYSLDRADVVVGAAAQRDYTHLGKADFDMSQWRGALESEQNNEVLESIGALA